MQPDREDLDDEHEDLPARVENASGALALLLIPAALVAAVGGGIFVVYRKFTGRVYVSQTSNGELAWELEAKRPLFGSEWTAKIRVPPGPWETVGTAKSGPEAHDLAFAALRERGLVP